ncbi:MAG: MFS transporter [Candidatus Tectimicrobiota bacterium]|nr:MAG: MFS transporter [Candidatus Tectomicrobia bacterium]
MARSQAVRAAWRVVVLFGLVSLLADVTYEGARSISGPFLALLGARAAVVGLVAGLGEGAGYGLRLLSGYLADRTRRYWTLTLLGYGVNLLAVPMLALAHHWPLAALLLVVERLGKALRTPARDVLLSYATSQVGHGRGFGVHEALDQIGAMAGPLFVAALLYAQQGYARSFALLGVPAMLALAALLLARAFFPQPQGLAAASPPPASPLPRAFWLYLAAAACLAASTADFPLIAYHLKAQALAPDAAIAVLYAGAMAVDAGAALAMGPLFDRHGLGSLLCLAPLTALVAPLAFSSSPGWALAGVGLWGASLGMQESVLRAAVATLVPPARRGTAFGLFSTGYGLAWFAGSTLLGLLYEASRPALVAFAAGLSLAALPLLWRLRHLPGT